MINKHEFIGKSYEEAVNKAKIDLQELEENLIINKKEEKKTLLSKKVEIEVIEKREVKEYLKKVIKNYEQTLGKQDRDILTNKHKVELLRLEAERGNNLPNAIKKILEEDKLQGIYNIIGNVIKTKDEYVRCLDVAISSSKNFVIVKDEESAKEAIR